MKASALIVSVVAAPHDKVVPVAKVTFPCELKEEEVEIKTFPELSPLANSQTSKVVDVPLGCYSPPLLGQDGLLDPQ